MNDVRRQLLNGNKLYTKGQPKDGSEETDGDLFLPLPVHSNQSPLN